MLWGSTESRTIARGGWGVIHISCNDTTSDGLILLLSRCSFLHERDGAASNSLRALKVLEEIVLNNGRRTIIFSGEWLDLTIVVRGRQGVAPTGPNRDWDLTGVLQRVELRSDVATSISFVSPHVDPKLVFCRCF